MLAGIAALYAGFRTFKAVRLHGGGRYHIIVGKYVSAVGAHLAHGHRNQVFMRARTVRIDILPVVRFFGGGVGGNFLHIRVGAGILVFAIETNIGRLAVFIGIVVLLPVGSGINLAHATTKGILHTAYGADLVVIHLRGDGMVLVVDRAIYHNSLAVVRQVPLVYHNLVGADIAAVNANSINKVVILVARHAGRLRRNHRQRVLRIRFNRRFVRRGRRFGRIRRFQNRRLLWLRDNRRRLDLRCFNWFRRRFALLWKRFFNDLFGFCSLFGCRQVGFLRPLKLRFNFLQRLHFAQSCRYQHAQRDDKRRQTLKQVVFIHYIFPRAQNWQTL